MTHSSNDILQEIGDTPLVRLGRIARGLPTPILAKCEYLNPGGSLKDRIALAIVDDAEKRGVIKPGDTLIEATGGNTGVGLAMVAAVRGYHLICVLPEKMSHDKRTALRLMGAEVIVTPDLPSDDPNNFRHVAERVAAERGAFLTDQFKNPANFDIHHRVTAEEIYRQTDGKISAFVAGVGTGGTISGVGRRLKELSGSVKIILADPVGSRLGGLVRTGELGDEGKYQLEGIGGSTIPGNFHPEVVDDAESVSDEEAFATTMRLIREEGLLVGGSSGATVAVAMRIATQVLDGPIVTLLGDSWDRYWSKEWMAKFAQEEPLPPVQPELEPRRPDGDRR